MKIMEEDNKAVGNPDKDNDGNKFVGIPIEEFVAAPLVAVSDSQKRLVQSAFEFMQEIGFTEEGKTRMVEFNLQNPINGSTTPLDITVKAPFIGLVPLPNLLIDDVQVDFQMEVTATEKSSDDGSSSANACSSFGWALCTANLKGNVHSSRETKGSTNRTPNYQVDASDHQKRQREAK